MDLIVAVTCSSAPVVGRVERTLYIKFDYLLLRMNEYSNIRSTGSDYQNVAVFCEAITENGRRKLDEEQNGRI